MSYYLDLCSGSQSLKSLFPNKKYISLDIEKKYDPDICINILEWDYKKYFKDNGMPFFIWFSPPCNEYSILNCARPNKIPDITGANKIVRRGLEIINYVNCKFVIENPQTGSLKKQGILDKIEFTDVDYCSYGFPYKKRTRLWNNVKLKGELCKKTHCPFMVGRRHTYSIGNSSYKTNVKEIGNKKTRLQQRYAIPPLLLESISNFVISK
jgi:hypothetical protein